VVARITKVIAVWQILDSVPVTSQHTALTLTYRIPQMTAMTPAGDKMIKPAEYLNHFTDLNVKCSKR
jgi:hypothetical protein